MNVEMAPLLYELALARFHKAKEELTKEKHQTSIYAEWRIAMNAQKHMAQAELDALDKVLREHGTTPAAELLIKEASKHVFFPKCSRRVYTNDSPAALCNNIASPNYETDCDKNCDHNIEE